MSNNLNLYDPLFYANEALIQLEKALGMAGRIHRGHDKSPQRKGSTIKINRPGTFEAQDEPSTAQDLNPEDIEIVLNFWRGVKVQLTDKELTFTTEQIINDHIRPMTVAIADDIDQKLALLANDVPWYHDAQATPDHKDIVDLNTVMFNNRVPMDESMLHLMIDGATYGSFMKDGVFTSADSNAGGGDTQQRGTLGRKFGYEIFRNQNVQSHVKGTLNNPSLLSTGGLKGASVLTFDSGSPAATGTVVPGDSFVLAGNAQRYAVTNTVTASAGALTGVTFTPELVVDHADNTVATFNLDNHTMNIGFHRNAFALAMAPLSEVGNGLGARMATVSDPITNIALRSRIWYEGSNSKVFVGIDCLYGLKTLDPNLAARLRG